MSHPRVEQLRFTRAEWSRGLRGVPEADGVRRFEPINSIGWIVGHLAWQEQRNWLTRVQEVTPVPSLNTLVANGAQATTPPLSEMLAAWREVTRATDRWLEPLTTEDLLAPLPGPGPKRSVGDSIQRVTFHYWFHIGEILAIRQLLGHPRRPEYVGDIERLAPYRAEDR